MFDDNPRQCWLVPLVGTIVLVCFVWMQFSVRPEVAEVLRSHCVGPLLRMSQTWSGGLGGNTWSDRSSFVCLRTLKAYTISASNSAPVKVTEEGSVWWALWLLGLVAWLGWRLWRMGSRGLRELKT